MGELTTARDLNLPVIVIVFPDASLAPIEMKQRAVTYADTAVDFPGTDYEKWLVHWVAAAVAAAAGSSSKALSRTH